MNVIDLGQYRRKVESRIGYIKERLDDGECVWLDELFDWVRDKVDQEHLSCADGLRHAMTMAYKKGKFQGRKEQ